MLIFFSRLQEANCYSRRSFVFVWYSQTVLHCETLQVLVPLSGWEAV